MGDINGRKGEVPLLFFENLIKYPDLGETNALVVFICGLNFSFKMLFLEYLEERNQNFPYGVFLLCVIDEMFMEVVFLQETRQADKQTYAFLKRSEDPSSKKTDQKCFCIC